MYLFLPCFKCYEFPSQISVLWHNNFLNLLDSFAMENRVGEDTEEELAGKWHFVIYIFVSSSRFVEPGYVKRALSPT